MKTIVFIAPEFFGFHSQIQKRLEHLGHKVHFIADRPSRHALIKIIIRKARFLMEPILNRYFAERTATIAPDTVDEVFIIRGEGLTKAALLQMKSRFKRARFQLYLWDSVKRSRGCLDLIPLMDRSWSYDLKDSKAYPQLRFTPNFYTLPQTPTFSRAPEENFKWDLVFFGTAHGDRLRVVSKLSQALPDSIRFYRFFYFQSPILYIFRAIFDRSFHLYPSSEKSLKPKFGKDWEEVVSQASAILDVHHIEQGGLTIRTLESLALGFKVITTDARICEYDFYDPRQIMVIDRHNPKVDPAFLAQPNRFTVHPSLVQLELTPWLNKIMAP